MEKGSYSHQPGRVICLNCRNSRAGGRVCPVCEAEDLQAGSAPPVDSASSLEWCELSSIFEAPHQIAAISVQAVLREEGIPAVVRSALIPAYGGVAMTLAGCWGWVLVPRDEAPRAQEVVRAYLKSIGVAPADGEA
jgi:hypothetical protein